MCCIVHANIKSTLRLSEHLLRAWSAAGKSRPARCEAFAFLRHSLKGPQINFEGIECTRDIENVLKAPKVFYRADRV